MGKIFTDNIVIQVKTNYEAEYSKPMLPNYIFSYTITIHNNNNFPVKLLSREWHITDSNGEIIQVKGEGVVGLTPEIAANGYFQYSSSVNLKSGIGKMTGKYHMKKVLDGDLFSVDIPEFQLEADFVLN